MNCTPAFSSANRILRPGFVAASQQPILGLESLNCWDGYLGGGRQLLLCFLWEEKRGEVEPEGLSGNLVVQLGSATEGLNRFVHSHKRP